MRSRSDATPAIILLHRIGSLVALQGLRHILREVNPDGGREGVSVPSRRENRKRSMSRFPAGTMVLRLR